MLNPNLIRPKVPEVTYETETVQEDVVKFTTEELDTDELLVGESRVIQEGVNGYTNVTYKVEFHDGIENNRVETGREIIDPIPKIVENGTRVEP